MPGVDRRAHCPQPSRPAAEEARKQAQCVLGPARLAARLHARPEPEEKEVTIDLRRQRAR